MSQDIAASLAVCPAFAGMDAQSLAHFASIAETVSFEAGQTVIEKGSPGDAFYVVLDGEADVVVDGDTSHAEDAALTAGDFFGEMAIIWNQPRQATIVAGDGLQVVRFPRGPLIQLLQQNRQLVDVLAQVGLLRAEENIERLLQLDL